MIFILILVIAGKVQGKAVNCHLRQFIISVALLPFLTIGGCRSNESTGSSQQSSGPQTVNSAKKPIKIVTTFLPVYLFTKAVAGETATVDILIKPGTEVHEYQSTPADVQAIAQADVVVKNGLGIEQFLDSTIKSAENSKLKVVNASQGIQPVEELSPVVEAANDKEHGHGNAGEANSATHEASNPHVWLDPELARKEVENIRDGLIGADPANKTTYQANAAAYIQQLNELDHQFKQSLRAYRDRTFITFHDAFPYLAKRYQLKQVAVVAIPEDQLSPGMFKERSQPLSNSR